MAFVKCECGFLKKNIPDVHIGKTKNCPKCGKEVTVNSSLFLTETKNNEAAPIPIQHPVSEISNNTNTAPRNSVISILAKEKSFPFVMLNIKSYDGLKILVLMVFLFGCWYFASGLIKLFTWQDKWYIPDTAVKTIYFFYHIFLFTIIYCFTWLIFDRKSIEGYVLSLFSIVFGIVYVLSPVDFVPEAIPFIGSFDDLLVGSGSIMVGVRSWYNSKNRLSLSSELSKLIENGKTEEAVYLFLKSQGYNLN